MTCNSVNKSSTLRKQKCDDVTDLSYKGILCALLDSGTDSEKQACSSSCEPNLNC